MGLGVAYKLEPSGIEFKEPVQLVFHYNEEEADEELQSLLGIAMQNEKGEWFELFNTQIDTKAKTISGNITHFSVWSKFMELILLPRNARLKVGNALVLNVITLKYNRPEPAPENIETNPVKGKKGDLTLTLLGPIILQYADGTSAVNLEVTMGEIDFGTPTGELSEAMLMNY